MLLGGAREKPKNWAEGINEGSGRSKRINEEEGTTTERSSSKREVPDRNKERDG